MNLSFFIWLLILLLFLSSMTPRGNVKEKFSVDTCPDTNLKMNISTAGSCLDMIKETDNIDELDVNSTFGHPYAADFLRSFNNYRFTTHDGNQTYGTGKCIIPPSQKPTFKLDGTCRGTNDNGDQIQLKLVPKTCQKMSYASSEYADLYDGCIVERADMPKLFNYAQGLLEYQKDEVVKDEIEENRQRYEINQQLLRDIDSTITQRVSFTNRANEASRNANNAISETSAQAQLEKYYYTEAGMHKAHVPTHQKEADLLKDRYDFLYNTSRMDASAAISPIPSNAQFVNVLGDVNMLPWSSWFRVNVNFPDKAAQWIHAVRGANISAPYNVGRPWKIYAQYVNNGPAFAAKVQFAADYYCDFIFNDAYKGRFTYVGPAGTYWELPVTIQNGRNVFRFDLTNVGGPSGLIARAVRASNDEVLVRSSGQWVWTQ